MRTLSSSVYFIKSYNIVDVKTFDTRESEREGEGERGERMGERMSKRMRMSVRRR